LRAPQLWWSERIDFDADRRSKIKVKNSS
jgi:hypothetical protein